MQSFQENPPDYFTDENKIPLIEWSNFEQGVLNTLNALLHFYTSLVDDKNFKSIDHMKRKAKLYEMKITEGLNYAKYLPDTDEYFKNEIIRIQKSFADVGNKSKGKSIRRSGYKIIKYAIYIFLVIGVFRACKSWAG